MQDIGREADPCEYEGNNYRIHGNKDVLHRHGGKYAHAHPYIPHFLLSREGKAHAGFFARLLS